MALSVVYPNLGASRPLSFLRGVGSSFDAYWLRGIFGEFKFYKEGSLWLPSLMFTHCIARLPNDIQLSYTDSGPVPGSNNYTTVIIIHGSAFNCRGFEKLHSFAPKHNMRIILLQRRDYPGSTKYTDDELDDLRNGRKSFIDRLAIQLGYFCQHLIDDLSIPKAKDRSGGISIMGWSFGTATAMSLFADPGVISKEMYNNLEKYVKDLVLYDPPYIALGYELPPDCKVYNPFASTNGSPSTEDIYEHFKAWVSSYYTIPSDWSGDINALDHRCCTEETTLGQWSSEEHATYFTMEAAVRSEWDMYREPMQTTLRKMARHVLFNEERAETFFPSVSVAVLCPRRTNWQCFWGCWVTEQLHNEHKRQGENIRPLCLVKLKDYNHFAHYDFPDEFLDAVQGAINQDNYCIVDTR